MVCYPTSRRLSKLDCFLDIWEKTNAAVCWREASILEQNTINPNITESLPW